MDKDKAATQHRLSRITQSLDIVVPRDCIASVILREVERLERRYFSIWLLVGRNEQQLMPAHYKYDGADTVRCDIPKNGEISAAAMEPHLGEFLKQQGMLPDGPPVIIGKGQ